MQSKPNRTLVFCTAYTDNKFKRFYTWDSRYRIWLDAINTSKLEYDQILLVDDGSQTLPDWSDTKFFSDTDDLRTDSRVAFFHFNEHLGRRAVSDFPGWVRSFFFVARYARENCFSKIIHIESDAFLISDRIHQFVNNCDEGWTALWCPLFNRPESAIQIIAGDAMQVFGELAQRNYEDFAGVVIEKHLPFTHVQRSFQGDRYGEYLSYIPRGVDWSAQTVPRATAPMSQYYWWLAGRIDFRKVEDNQSPITGNDEMYIKTVSSNLAHSKINYITFMASLDKNLAPRSYFEIGTHMGTSLKAFSCDAVCVDPKFMLEKEVICSRKRTFLFQGTSDEFFAGNYLAIAFPDGIDVAFLDGLHHFEALLRDFINTEKYAHEKSIFLLHDCLPLNERMAERKFRRDETEALSTQNFWTGDVWKLLPVLKKYRPDLRIIYLDCGPTGLVACTNVDRNSRILSDKYDAIISEFQNLTLASFRREALWSLFPTIDTERLLADAPGLRATFGYSDHVPTQGI